MEPIGSIQGLASGIDFRALVDAIVEAESRPAVLLSQRKAELDRETTAWGDVELRLRSAFDRSKELADPLFFKKFNAEVLGDESPLSATASTSAVPGSFAVEVLQLATREKVGSDVFQDRDVALGLDGEFVVGGQAVQIAANDSLDDVAQAINAASARGTGGGVAATVVGAATGGHRIVLTADDSGTAGIRLADGSQGLLRTLGFVDSTTSIKHQTSNGAMSDTFTSGSASVGSLLGLTQAPAPTSVTIGALSVTIDLGSDSLEDIAAAINAAASAASSPIAAQVVLETAKDGSTVRRLDIDNTTSFVDSNGILETLGIVEAGRGDVAQTIQGAQLTDDDATTPVTASTRFRDIWANGSDADVTNGDTLTITGTHGDGSTFTKTVSFNGGDRLSDLLDELNSASDGFGVGGRTATASIVDGRIVVTDDTGGTSQLSLSIVSNNEGGGSLDFGAFGVTSAGREREIAAGADAELLVDGALYTRSTNAITDVVEGVTLNLSGLSSGGPVTVDVSQDTDAIAQGVEDFVKAFNAVSEFVLSQFTGIGAEEDTPARPLSGDRVVRQVRDQMRAVLQNGIAQGLSSFGSLSELGIEANSEGTYTIDRQKLDEAVATDPAGIERIFSAFGTGNVSSLDFVSASADVPAGTYELFVTTPAERASVTGSGFGGTYVDDGVADTLTVTDTSTGSIFDIALTNGMTLSDIVDALNAEFSTPTARELNASQALSSDAIGTAATDATALEDLHDGGGTNLGVANGDTFTISGTKADGSTFFREWTVANAASQTLGSLQAEISNAIGTDVVIDVSNGILTATAIDEGSSQLSLTVSSDNAGGGTFSIGSMIVVEEGRSAVSIAASDDGGELSIAHDDFGSASGFSVAYTAGGTDGSASLGVAAGSYVGVDIAGTIGGHAATGTGILLEANEGTDLEGLVLEYSGGDTGAVGELTYARGLAAMMESVTDRYLDGSDGSIQGIVDRLDTQKRGIDERIERLETRLEIRAEALTKRFTALEEALAAAQSESSWIQATLGSLAAPAF